MIYGIYTSFCLCLIFSRTRQEWQYHISTSKIMVMQNILSSTFRTKAYCKCTWKIGEQTLFGAKYSCIIQSTKAVSIGADVYINSCFNRYCFKSNSFSNMVSSIESFAEYSSMVETILSCSSIFGSSMATFAISL